MKREIWVIIVIIIIILIYDHSVVRLYHWPWISSVSFVSAHEIIQYISLDR